MTQLLFLHRGDISNFKLVNNSIDLIVTSPPYYKMRTYDVQPTKWWDGWKGQLGSEPNSNMYINHLTHISGVLYEALKPSGVMLFNINDCSASSGGSGSVEYSKRHKQFGKVIHPESAQPVRKAEEGFKNKDLMGIPWRVAESFQRIGWLWRETIVWNKSPAMPEPHQDRPSRCWEPILMFTKSPKNYFNKPKGLTNVWNINSRRKNYGHFATFPVELALQCIKIACPEGGVVLDPFSGSGSVLIATTIAYNTLKCIGIGVELSQKYIDITQKRLEEEVETPYILTMTGDNADEGQVKVVNCG